MYKYFIIIAIFLGSLFSMETVAIIDLEGIGVSANDAKALTQRLTSQMIQIGKYTIVERSEMKRLLDEQKFQYSGCVDVKCAVEIGKMLGAKTMVVGSVSKVGTIYSVDARMIDVQSAENYISADYTTTEDIGDLLIEGMKSIAYQLCEKEYTKSKIKSNQSSNNTSNSKLGRISFNGIPTNDVQISLNGTSISSYGSSIVAPGLQKIIISKREFKTITDEVYVSAGENYIYEYNLDCGSYIGLKGSRGYVDAFIDGEKISEYGHQIDPGKYSIFIKPINPDLQEIQDSIIVKECETTYYQIDLKKKQGKVSIITEPHKASIRIGGMIFDNNSLYDYNKYVYKVTHPYYYPQISSFTLSTPIYEEKIILKSGRKDFRKLRNRKKKARIASIVSLLGLGISYYLHEDAYDKYNSATTPEKATKYRDLTNNMYNVQIAFGRLSAVSVSYTFYLQFKFSNLKKVLSIKNPKKNQNQKQKKKQNKNRKSKQ